MLNARRPRAVRTTQLAVLAVVLAVLVAGIGPFVTIAAAASNADSEPNDTPSEADDIVVGTTYEGTIEHGDTFAWDREHDYYRFTANAGDRIEVTGYYTEEVNPTNGYGIDFQLVATNENGVLGDVAWTLATPLGDGRTTGAVAPYTGTYYLDVESYDALGTKQYNFTVRTAPETDAYEPNDDAAEPVLIDAGSYDANAYYFDPDYYVYDAAAGENLTITYENRETNAGSGTQFITVNRLFPICDVTTCAGLPTSPYGYKATVPAPGGTVSLEVPVLSGGYVYIRIDGHTYDLADERESHPYTLTVTSDRTTEPGSSRESAIDLGSVVPGGPGNETAATLPSGESRWYSFRVPEGFPVAATLTTDASKGDLDIRLYDGTTLVDDGTATADVDEVTGGPGSGGLLGDVTFYVELVGKTPTDGGTYTLEVASPDDVLENDDSPSTATALPVVSADDFGIGFGLDSTLAPHALAPTDPDWFVMDLGPANETTVYAIFSEPRGSVTLTVFDANLTQVAENTSSTGTATAALLTDGQPYYVRVSGGANAYGPYGPIGVYTPETERANDLYDLYARNDDAANATTIGTVDGVGTPLRLPLPSTSSFPLPPPDPSDLAAGYATPPEARLDADDTDWYAFDAPHGFTGTVDLRPMDGIGSYDARLYDDAGTLLAERVSVTGDTTLPIDTGVIDSNTTSLVHSTYRLELAGGDGAINYSVAVTLHDDQYEPNDDRASATPTTTTPLPEFGDTSPNPGVVPGVYPLAVVGDDADWFAFDVVAGETVTAIAAFEHADGDLSVGVYGPGDALVATSESATDDETVSFVAAETGTYLLAVFGYGDPAAVYRLATFADSTPEPIDANDLFDLSGRNDDRTNASALGTLTADGEPLTTAGYDPGPFPSPFPLPDLSDLLLPAGFAYPPEARLDANDTDWYAFDASETGFVGQLDVTVVDGSGQYDLRLYNEYGTVATLRNQSGDASVSFSVPEDDSGLLGTPDPGTYHVELAGLDDPINYTLSVTPTEAAIDVAGGPTATDAAVTGVRPNTAVGIAVDQGTTDVTLESLTVTSTAGAYTLNVTASDTPPAGTDTLALAAGGFSLGYFEIDHSVSDAAIEEAVFRFSVSKAALIRAGATPSEVILYRYAGSKAAPTPLPTTQVEETPLSYTFETVSPGLSMFAVGVPLPYDLTGVSVVPMDVVVGEPVSVTITIVSLTDSDVDAVLTLTADGETVATTTATVPSGSLTTVDVAYVFENPGVYAVAVDDVPAGTVVVRQLVPIEVKPHDRGDEGDDRPVPVNPRSQGRLPVAIFAVDGFDPVNVDVSTLRFGPDGATAERTGLEDVNDDGHLDRIVHFRTPEAGFVAGDTTATLIGWTNDGIPFVGSDKIRIVGSGAGGDREAGNDETPEARDGK